MRRALLPLLVLVLAGTACAGSSSAPQRGTEYTVVARLLAASGRPIYACYFIPAAYPPLDTCGGVEVRNVDVATVAALGGDHPFRGGTRMSRGVRLVGTWDGQALTLTKRPVPADYTPEQKPFVPAPTVPVPPPSGEAAALAETSRIAGDSSLRREGVQVMSAGVGTHGMDVDVLLVVADARAVQALRRHYASVYVVGWMRPVTQAIGS